MVDGLVESELALFDQHHGGGRSDGFRHRRDAEDRVVLDRAALAERLHPKRVNILSTVSCDERDESRYLAALDIRSEHAAHRPLGVRGVRRDTRRRTTASRQDSGTGCREELATSQGWRRHAMVRHRPNYVSETQLGQYLSVRGPGAAS